MLINFSHEYRKKFSYGLIRNHYCQPDSAIF